MLYIVGLFCPLCPAIFSGLKLGEPPCHNWQISLQQVYKGSDALPARLPPNAFPKSFGALRPAFTGPLFCAAQRCKPTAASWQPSCEAIIIGLAYTYGSPHKYSVLVGAKNQRCIMNYPAGFLGGRQKLMLLLDFQMTCIAIQILFEMS